MKSVKKKSLMEKSNTIVSLTLKRNPNHADFFNKKAQEASDFLNNIELKF